MAFENGLWLNPTEKCWLKMVCSFKKPIEVSAPWNFIKLAGGMVLS